MEVPQSTLPPPPKKHQGLKFGHPQQQQQEMPDASSMNSDINSLSRRLRLLEEGFTNLRRFFQVTEENMIAKNKHFSAEIKTMASDIIETKKEVQEVRDKLMLVIRELQTVARKEEVKVLEKYINLWNPIKFVTQNEVEQIISEILDKRNSAKKEG